jgi:hypothetical protein
LARAGISATCQRKKKKQIRNKCLVWQSLNAENGNGGYQASLSQEQKSGEKGARVDNQKRKRGLHLYATPKCNEAPIHN